MKKALTLLLAVAAIMCFATFAVSAEETTEPVHTDHCYCVNGEAIPTDHVCEENVVWEDLTAATIADGGHYYLPKSTAKGLVVDGIEITVCLNGYNLFAGVPITVTNGGVVNICNCKPAASSRIYSSTRSSSGVVVISSESTVNLYSGRISGAANNSTHTRCVDITGGVFNMYGGEVVNGHSDGTVDKDTYKGKGGNINVRNSTAKIGEFNMFAGTVTGGQATDQGGNIFVRGAKVTMNGGTVTGGNATNYGGNIYAFSIGGKAGTVTINGGTVTGGKAPFGGNICLDDSAGLATLTMENGTVSNGQATNLGGNIYIRGAKFNLNGGTVSAGSATGTPAESGTDLIGYGGNIFIGSVNSKKGTVALNAGTVTGGSATYGGNICTQGMNGAVNLTVAGTTISSGVATADGGNLYIRNDGNGTVLKLSSGSITAGQATGNGGNIYVSGGYVPTWAGGTVSNGTATDGGNICFDCGTTTNSFTGTNVTGGTATSRGGNIMVQESGAINISAGTISGGTASAGGNIYCRKTLNVTGGTIFDGTSTNSGGNIYSANNKLTVSGGEITGGKAGTTGGNIYALSNTVDIIGGTISGGEATGNGGNLYITDTEIKTGKTITISNVTISGGITEGQGGNIYVAKTDILNMTNVTALNGKSSVNGANVYLMQNNTGTITGCTFTIEEAEKCSSSGGNLVLAGNSYTVADTTISGGDAEEGGAVALGQTTTAIFDGCTIESAGGTTGRCFYVYQNATVTLMDCDVNNLSDSGTAIWNKGALILQGTVNMPGMTLDLMLDCRSDSGATINISELTAQDEAFSLRRWEIDNKEDDLGLVATGANADNFASIFAWSDGYELVFDGEAGTLTMVYMPVLGRNADGIARAYYSLDEAFADEQDMGITWFELTTDLDGQTITKNVLINLNGYNLTNTTVNQGVSVKLFDSANDSFDATACGTFTGTVNGQVNSVVHTNTANGGSIKHYVIIKDAQGVYTAHRFVAAITHRSLKPTEAALGFKAAFNGDDVARAAAVAYGFEMWVDDGTAVVSAKQGTYAKNEYVTLRLKNILSDNEATSKVGANGTIYGNPFITFVVDAEGTQVTANGQNAPTATTLKSFVEAVDTAVAADPAVFSETQMTAVQTLVNTYSKYMTDWATSNIVAWTVPVEDPTEPPVQEPTEEPTEDTTTEATE